MRERNDWVGDAKSSQMTECCRTSPNILDHGDTAGDFRIRIAGGLDAAVVHAHACLMVINRDRMRTRLELQLVAFRPVSR